VHRIVALKVLAPGLGAGGFACLVAAAARTPGAGPWLWLAVGLLAAAAASATVAAALVCRQCTRLGDRLESMTQAGRLASIPPDELAAAGLGADGAATGPCRSVGRLIASVNDIVRYADAAISEAALKTRELELHLKVATAERQHAEAIIYSISDAVLVTDTFDEIVLANESAARTFDFDLERAQRRGVDQILRDPKIVTLIREMRQSDGRGGRRVVEHRVRTPGGIRTFKITLSTVSDGPEGDTARAAADDATNLGAAAVATAGAAGVVAVLHDVTHEKEISEMKNDFVSNVSHELRTPLASIKAYVELLIDGEADDEKTKREFYEVIQNEANRLGRLIDNILNISRIESGLVKIDRKPQGLTAIVKDALEVIAQQAEQKGLRLIERMTPVAYQASVDRDMLFQAVLNVLSNAVKYTQAGGEITVETSVDESRRKVVLRVTDTGVGIAPQDLPYVFEKFYRADASSRMAPGTGLGLSLVKHIIETVHQGRTLVQSEVGKGSCFGFELDLCE
jgi:two-component system phosphate regulon sensor histidine kinase PhoR